MQQLQLYRYNEPLEKEELAFLLKKEVKERKQFYKLIRVLMVFCFVCPFIIGWFRALNDVPDPFSYLFYFSSVLFLTCFSGFAVYMGYSISLRRVQEDLRIGTKTIEQTTITRRQYVPHNNTYYFYLSSPNKLSIEVKVDDYHTMKDGDELSIEYTTYSKMYLGYF
jgi:hypothetical protein